MRRKGGMGAKRGGGGRRGGKEEGVSDGGYKGWRREGKGEKKGFHELERLEQKLLPTCLSSLRPVFGPCGDGGGKCEGER